MSKQVISDNFSKDKMDKSARIIGAFATLSKRRAWTMHERELVTVVVMTRFWILYGETTEGK